jgi:hypothetical protein
MASSSSISFLNCPWHTAHSYGSPIPLTPASSHQQKVRLMIRSDQLVIGTVASILAASTPTGIAGPSGWFYMVNGATGIYLGASHVGTANGLAVAAAGTLSGYLFSGDQLYACTAGTTSSVSILQSGQ